jgi:hypothetical protein
MQYRPRVSRREERRWLLEAVVAVAVRHEPRPERLHRRTPTGTSSSPELPGVAHAVALARLTAQPFYTIRWGP